MMSWTSITLLMTTIITTMTIKLHYKEAWGYARTSRMSKRSITLWMTISTRTMTALSTKYFF